MSARVSVVIPAYQEESRVGETVAAVRSSLERMEPELEIVVVDDGSTDATGQAAAAAGARVLRLARNGGKGAALTAGLNSAGGDVLLMLDADLKSSAAEAIKLLEPVLGGRADMTVATFPKAGKGAGGFGFVMRLARWGLRLYGAAAMHAPLSGQRAITRDAWRRIGRLDPGFAVEMGLNLDAGRLGLRVEEVPTSMSHRATGRDLSGFLHRGRQFRDILGAIVRRWPVRSR